MLLAGCLLFYIFWSYFGWSHQSIDGLIWVMNAICFHLSSKIGRRQPSQLLIIWKFGYIKWPLLPALWLALLCCQFLYIYPLKCFFFWLGCFCAANLFKRRPVCRRISQVLLFQSTRNAVSSRKYFRYFKRLLLLYFLLLLCELDDNWWLTCDVKSRWLLPIFPVNTHTQERIL